MKLSQNLFFLSLSLRFPRGSLEKSQKFGLMEITISLSVMLLLMSFRIVKPKELLLSTFRDCSVFVVVVSLLSPFYISSWRSDTILASKTVLFCFFYTFVPCWLSILNIAVYTCPSQTPNLFSSTLPPW